MTPPQRRQLALEALAGTETVRWLAGQHAVSRKFVYQQAAKAEESVVLGEGGATFNWRAER